MPSTPPMGGPQIPDAQNISTGSFQYEGAAALLQRPPRYADSVPHL